MKLREPVLDQDELTAFDLLERRTDGTTTWRGVVYGLAAAQTQIRRLMTETGHQCFALGEGGTIAVGQEELAA
jgi:hypothetical protein